MRSRRILVVDDHEDLNSMLVDLLISRGHSCLGVLSAKAALDVAAAFRPDVILLEWGLKSGGGLDLPRLLRAQAAQDLMIIVLTAHDLPDDFDRVQVDACTLKPASLELLEELLESDQVD